MLDKQTQTVLSYKNNNNKAQITITIEPILFIKWKAGESMLTSRFQSKSLVAQAVLSALLFTPNLALSAEEKEQESKFEIIEVTSQKRVQSALEVPLAVSTVNEDTIKESGSLLLMDVDKFIPGFDFGEAFEGELTQAGVTMRGISSPDISVGGDPSTAVFYDDVYMPRAAQNIAFSDLERIEVLKGPQGTLFGRNAAMGVVSIIPNSPNEDFEGFVKARLGTDNLVRLEGMVNVPVSDKLFVRANILSNRQDGYIDNVANPEWDENFKHFDFGEKSHDAARIALKFEISDKTNLQVSYDWDKLDQSPSMAIGISEWAYNGGTNIFASKAENDVSNAVEKRDMYGITAKLDSELSDHWSMKYVLSYRDWETENRQDEDGTADITRYFYTSNNEDSDILYTELQFNYIDNKISAVAGFSYSEESVSQTTEMVMTTDTAARLITQDLNQQVVGLVNAEVQAGLAAAGITSDETAQAAGLGSTLEEAIENYKLANNIVTPQMDHMWNADEFAATVNALGAGPLLMAEIGFPNHAFDAGIVNALANEPYPYDAYEMVSAALPSMIGSTDLYIPEIFGPQYSGMFWQESINNTGEFTNWGIFADIDYAITDKWNLIAGVRYSKDEKDFTWYIPLNSFATVPVNQLIADMGAAQTPINNILFEQANTAASNSWEQTTGRLVTSYKLDDKNMVYASLSTGYKSGGYDSLAPPTTDEEFEGFEPEETTNFELGYKGILADELITNLSIYRLELANQQISVDSLDPTDSSGAAKPIILNRDTDITGIELDMRWKPNDSLTLGAITDIRSMDITTPQHYNNIGELIARETTSEDSATNYTLTLDWLPDWTYKGGNYSFHIDYQFVENTSHLDTSIPDFVFDIDGYTNDIQNLNARFSWYRDNLEVALWGNNLLDERYVSGGGGLTVGILGTGHVKVNRGIETGIELIYRFD